MDGHLWFSVITKPVRSRFTRVQRLTCLITVLFTTMLTNIINYNVKASMPADDDPVLLRVGSVPISEYSVKMGILSSLISIPVNVLIVILFSKRRIRPRKEKPGKTIVTTEKYKVESEMEAGKVDIVDEDEEDEDEIAKR